MKTYQFIGYTRMKTSCGYYDIYMSVGLLGGYDDVHIYVYNIDILMNVLLNENITKNIINMVHPMRNIRSDITVVQKHPNYTFRGMLVNINQFKVTL